MWWMVTAAIAAPPPDLLPDARQSVWASFAWDPAWVGQVGIRAPLTDRSGARSWGWNAAITTPLALLGEFGNGAIWTGVTVCQPVGRWSMQAAIDSGLTRSVNELGRHIGWGADLTLRPLWELHHGRIGPDLGWRQGISTHIRHSAAVVDLFDDRPAGAIAGPRNGWYRAPVSRGRAGVAGGRRLGARNAWALSGRGGFEGTIQRQGLVAQPSLGQLPFYLYASAEYTW